MSRIINKNPNKFRRKSGKGLNKSKTNFGTALGRTKRGFHKYNNEQVFVVPKRNRYGKIINEKFIPIDDKNIYIMKATILRRNENE